MAKLHRYTDAETRFIKKNVKGRGYAELAALFNKKFRRRFTEKQIAGKAYRLGLSNGRPGSFLPGQIPFNKGWKGVYFKGAEKGWFKPGQKPVSTRPVGSERAGRGGYVEVKISNHKAKRKKWKLKHALIWEQAHGKIPKGHAVMFADGDKTNFAVGNLLLVSRGELAVMNKQKLVSDNADLTKIGKTVAGIMLLRNKRKREAKKNAPVGRGSNRQKFFKEKNHGTVKTQHGKN